LSDDIQNVLVLGGYGFFGARICRALASSPAIRLLIGGRSAENARRLAHELGLAREQAVGVDASSSQLPEVLKERRVGVLIHAAGPFQGQDYAVARAAIGARCHYVDLADGRQFVNGIENLEADARAAGITVMSGASSVPALSSAVVDHYLPRFERLESIEIGISSGAKSPGLATIRGVFSYAGKPVRTLKNGAWSTQYGWRSLTRHRFPPPLGSRWLASCEVPDLDVLPRRYPTVKSVTFKAGFANDAGHLLVWFLAGLVKIRLIPSMTAFASPLSRVSGWIEPLVSDKGGMFVCLEGVDPAGQPIRINWNLIAEHNHGPFIPCGAAIVLATKIAAGCKLPTGAFPCTGLLTLNEYLGALQGLDVREVVE
jgi:saccharopine dehydrogenase-like protein